MEKLLDRIRYKKLCSIIDDTYTVRQIGKNDCITYALAYKKYADPSEKKLFGEYSLIALDVVTLFVPVGSINFFIKYEERNEWTAYENSVFIRDFFVKDDYRNKGYGSIILSALIEQTKKYNAKKICGILSWVDSDNFDRSKHVYKKFGFSIDGDNLSLDLTKNIE
jgi:GNAT superfamily N-acetyltransferase